MHFATYTRKSVYSDKSDSVDNQQRMCREYVEMKYPNDMESFTAYTDEGISGATTDRPDLQRLLADIRDGLVDCLVVYQLDRLSRNVRDFSNIYADLEEHGVKFISLKETIDTSTPIGKAMMLVTMVFAQMERETIAERVSDNMHGLVKKGYWPIGTVPTGYKRKKIETGGKKHSTLEIDPDGAKYIKSVYCDFLESTGSVQSLETRYRNEGKRTLNGCFFSQAIIYRILTTPFYCEATPEVYDFWQRQGCQMAAESSRDKWDGSCGVMVYGRRNNKKGTSLRPKEEWLVCLGMHPAIISADDWLAVQEKFKKNTFNKTMKYDTPLLKGIVRCAKCGSILSVSRKQNKNSTSSFYFCLKRDHQGIEACDMKSLKCDKLDNKALAVFAEIEADQKAIWNYTKKDTPKDNADTIKDLERKAAAIRSRIQRLTESLAAGSSAAKYIIKQIEAEDLSLAALNREIDIAKAAARRKENEEKSVEQKAGEIARMMHNLSDLSTEEKNEIVRGVVKKCSWDGESLFLIL